ncbi:MAG TPA: TIGR03118 family protein [Thermoanaerobaculia bacterium]
MNMHERIAENIFRHSAMAAAAIALMLGLPANAGAQYKEIKLVSDIAGQAAITDPLLINPWGVSFPPTGPFWVSDAGSNTATVYAVDGTTGAVAIARPPVSIDRPPSGQVFNGSADFVVSSGMASGPGIFLFASLNGQIFGWNPNVPAPGSNTAILGATGTPPPVAYTGLAIGTRGTDPFLFAANNAAGRVDVFDKNFTKVTVPGGFTDPNLPAGDLPFDVVNIGGDLYVTYSGPVGAVNVFDTDGNLMSRFATGGTLLNPWGIAVAPADFGEFSSAVLVGNFNFGNPSNGPGSISAFDSTGTFLGLLKDENGVNLSIDGLWSLRFGNGVKGGIKNVLYFSAGIEGQTHGLFGALAACGPVITGISATPNVLWPPDHKLVPVSVNYTVQDSCDSVPVCSLSVSSNEGAGGGSGNASPDSQIIDAHDVSLRAERAGTGDTRIYTITVSCTDKLGLTSSAVATVTLPHDQKP